MKGCIVDFADWTSGLPRAAAAALLALGAASAQATAIFSGQAGLDLELVSNPQDLVVSITDSDFFVDSGASATGAVATAGGTATPTVELGDPAVPMDIDDSVLLGAEVAGSADGVAADAYTEASAFALGRARVVLDNLSGIGDAAFAFALDYEWIGEVQADTDDDLASLDLVATLTGVDLDTSDDVFAPVTLFDVSLLTGSALTDGADGGVYQLTGLSVPAGDRWALVVTLQLLNGLATSDAAVPLPPPLVLLGLGLPLLRIRRLPLHWRSPLHGRQGSGPRE